LTVSVLEQVRDFIAGHALLKPGEHVVAGVSGGADSLCLLDTLHKLGYAVRVVHVDHQLRPESGAEAEFTRRIAAAYGLEAQIEVADVGAWARPGRSLEEAARLARYDSLARAAHAHETRILATGHTADDQAETILMHFLRGAGPDGLRGMQPLTELNAWVDIPAAEGLRLVRPLLGLRRADTTARCAELGLSPCQDASNADLTFRRNRLRHELLPALETYNPRIREALLRTGQVMAAHSDLVSELVAEAWPSVVRRLDPEGLRIHLPAFSLLPVAVQRGVIRRAAGAVRPGLRDLGWEAIERARRFLADPPATRQADWIAGLRLRHWGDEAAISLSTSELAFPEFPQLAEGQPQAIPIPGRVGLAGGWMLVAEAGSADLTFVSSLPAEAQARQVVLDAEALSAPLALRPPAPGDRLRPLGLDGSTKVADLLVDRHIPRPARRRWPIVVAGEEPVWVVGLRQAELGRLTSHTRHAIHLRLISP